MPKKIEGLSNIKAIAGGGLHSLAMDGEGNVFSWGEGGNNLDFFYTYYNGRGQLARVLSSAKAIAAGNYHSLAILEDGSVYEWGHYMSTQMQALNPGRKVPFWFPPRGNKVQGLGGVKAISAGSFNSLALGMDGKVYGWGYTTKEHEAIGTMPWGETTSYRYSEYSSSFAAVQLEIPFPASCVDPVVSFTASPTVLGSATTFTDLTTNAAPDAAYSWDFDGDGIADSYSKGNATFTYPAPGTYSARLTVGNGICEQSFSLQVNVQAPPIASFVTGGGKFPSPAGAYKPAPDTNPAMPYVSPAGEATFNLTSKYEKGNLTPIGATHIKFKLANMNFESTAQEWLTVSGSLAQYQGSGKINGTGNYGYLVMAVDGDGKGNDKGDRLRVKIWDKRTGFMVYDNEREGTAGGAPSTAITQGSIVIHQANIKSIGSKAVATLEPSLQLHQNIPNPFSGSTHINFEVKESAAVSLKVYNLMGQEVATLFNGTAEAGKLYETTLQSGNLAGGVYYYTLSNGGWKVTKRMVLNK
ncbi:T9SS type A sorting domain-containing protein [Rufibacter tibetensis]|uniref:PKD domain-containing protein n=1 Tax=Rufibacter tibetensis TaxID=512763 RepID=A0A0P0CVC7_9BACT|nr:T9SS type A sorting domain-containing protein [Rufibacter tibetensis]ALI98331.1 hypothetical protein DC20_04190 [Rufibacter tibetensis]